ncbi:MAG: hypothetical protein Q6366_005855 [Candidatus Freyarchaeota archaeon]
MSSFLNRIRYQLKVADVWPILRRFLMNTVFDSVLTCMGIIIGAATASSISPLLIFGTTLTGALALGISSGVSTFEAERFESVKRLKELEKSMLRDLDETIHYKASRTGQFIVGITNFSVPILVALALTLPIILVQQSTIAIYITIGVAIAILFGMGMYFGKISKANMVLRGIRTAAIGIGTFIICYYISFLY